jgi:hypothetical protein
VSISSIVQRVVWAVLVLVHLAPWAATFRRLVFDEVCVSAVVSHLLLSVAIVFFLLKFIDLPHLRWSASRRGLLLLLIVFGLVHGRATTAVAGHLVLDALPAAAAASALAAALANARRIPTLLRRMKTMWTARLQECLASAWHGVGYQIAFAAMFEARLSAPRAPPRLGA